MRMLLCSALFALILAPSSRAALPTLIPRKVLFDNPVKAGPSLSPDGKKLGYIAPDKNNVLQVFVQTLGKDDAKQVTSDKKRGIRAFSWLYRPDTLVYGQDKDGDENYHVYLVDLKTDKVTDLTPYDGVRAGIQGVNRDFPDEILISMNKRKKEIFDVYRLNLKTKKMELEVENPGNVISWATDNKFRVRIATVPTADGGMELRYRKDDKSKFKKLLTWGQDDAEGGVLGFTKDNKSVYLETSEGRDTLSLVKRDLATGKETLIATDPKADLSGAIINPFTHEVEAVAFTYEKRKWKALDKEMAAHIAALDKGADGQWSIAGGDKARKTWVVAYSSDVKPTVWYLYDRSTKKLTKLFAAKPQLDKYTLAPMKPVVIKSRDGLNLVSYLTLPVGVKHKNLPLVLYVHGGPWARDSWGFDPTAQWLANRGYAVLSVNFRGSTGFGKKFLQAGNKQWAKKMHDDLIDAVNWAVKEGYANKKKVAIYGGSYGGYAALVGATFTPDVFACAISVVGPSNLITLLKSIPPYWKPIMTMFELRVGSLKDEAYLKSISPLFKVDKIKIPVMIAQGKNDPRVKQAESEQIVDAMKKAGKPVEYLLFEDEGHGFVRPANRLKFMAAAEKFLAKHMGGRKED